MELDDTTPHMREVYRRRMAELTPAQRTHITAELCRAGHATQCAAVRQRYPDATKEEVRYHVAVMRYGKELADKVYGPR